MLALAMPSKVPAKKKQVSRLEKDYRDLFAPPTDTYDNNFLKDFQRLSPYRSILSVTTYGAYEEPI